MDYTVDTDNTAMPRTATAAIGVYWGGGVNRKIVIRMDIQRESFFILTIPTLLIFLNLSYIDKRIFINSADLGLLENKMSNLSEVLEFDVKGDT